MASLFRPWYTVPGPDGSRVKRRSKTWYGQYKDAAGRVQRVSLGTTNKEAAQLKLADLVRGAAAPAERRPIGEQVDAWCKSLQDRQVPVTYRRLLAYHVRRIVDGCKWKTLVDVNHDAVDRYLTSLVTDRSRGHSGGPLSPKTRNDYRESLRTFMRWCLRQKRVAAWPFDGWGNESTTMDRRHDRRPLTPQQLGALLQAAMASERVYRGLTGEDRYFLYLTACATGFRVSELASLTPASFALHEKPPVVRLAASSTKNKKPARQPLAAEIVPLLRAYLAGKPTDKPVWPGRWTIDAPEMMRPDMDAAGIPYIVQGPDGPLYADFHALRHSFIALLDVPGMSLKRAMQLARHSDPRLTMRVYGRAHLEDLSSSVSEALAPTLARAAREARPGSGKREPRRPESGDGDGQSAASDDGSAQDSDGDADSDGIAHRWTHGFFVVHAEALAQILALAVAAKHENRHAA